MIFLLVFVFEFFHDKLVHIHENPPYNRNSFFDIVVGHDKIATGVSRFFPQCNAHVRNACNAHGFLALIEYHIYYNLLSTLFDSGKVAVDTTTYKTSPPVAKHRVDA
jgi:hypothetical protein